MKLITDDGLGQKENLLLVDDTELFLTLEETFLSRSDFALHTARSQMRRVIGMGEE